MSFTKGPSISLTYEQVEELVSQLENAEKLKLARKLKKEGIEADWDSIFRSLKPNQVSEREILKVTKQVRSRLQAKRREATAGRR